MKLFRPSHGCASFYILHVHKVHVMHGKINWYWNYGNIDECHGQIDKQMGKSMNTLDKFVEISHEKIDRNPKSPPPPPCAQGQTRWFCDRSCQWVKRDKAKPDWLLVSWWILDIWMFIPFIRLEFRISFHSSFVLWDYFTEMVFLQLFQQLDLPLQAATDL